MVKIPVVLTEDGSMCPSLPYPLDTVLVVVSEEFYTCYQSGDTLPTEEETEGGS